MEFIIAIVKLALLAAIVVGSLAVGAMMIGMAFLLHRALFCQREPRQHRGGWKWILVPLALVLLVPWITGLIAGWATHDPNWQEPAQIAKQNAERAKADARKAVDRAKQRAKHQQKSMQQLWEELNKPRIELNGEERTDSRESHDPSMDKPSLDHATERLEGFVEKASTAARRASDVGTIIGQTLIALQRTDAPVPAPVADVPPPGEAALAAAVAVDVASPAPAPRPDWIDDPPKRIGELWCEVVVTDEFATDEECRRQADERMLQATAEYIRQFAGNSVDPVEHVSATGETTRQFPALSEMGVSVGYVRHEIATDEYFEVVEHDFGPMRRSYTKIEFSPSVQNDLRRRWDDYLQHKRLSIVGLGAGSVLGLIGLAYGLLKVDTWTKGYYSKRLFLGVPAAIIGILVLLSLLGV